MTLIILSKDIHFVKVFHKTFEIQYVTCNDLTLLPFANIVSRSILSNKWSNARRKYFCSATGGADSGPASLEGTPTDDKNGQQAFGAGKFRDINVNISFSVKINSRHHARVKESLRIPFTLLFARLKRLM